MFDERVRELIIPSRGELATESQDSDYVPAKWALVVLGGFDYFRDIQQNGIQRVEKWLQGRGVPYDLFQDNDIDTPSDDPKDFSLQYANGTIRYQVLVLINDYPTDSGGVNQDYIYWAVGNGTNAVVFGTCAKIVPKLLDIIPENVIYDQDFSAPDTNCTILRTFDDEIKKFEKGTYEIVKRTRFHSILQVYPGKTVWFNMTWSHTWAIGMMNGTYGKGAVWYHSFIPKDHLMAYSCHEKQWSEETSCSNYQVFGHSINFIFNQAEQIPVSIMPYKRWKGAWILRVDCDSWSGMLTFPSEEAMIKGWVWDLVICSLEYFRIGGGGSVGDIYLADGLPAGYSGAPSTTIKHGNVGGLMFGNGTQWGKTYAFIIYNSTVAGDYDRIRFDFNANLDYSDDTSHEVWENITYLGMDGTHYWCYVDPDFTNPSAIRLGWRMLLRDRPSDRCNFTKWREYGSTYGISFDFHGWSHEHIGYAGQSGKDWSFYYYWNGSEFIQNETYIEQKYNLARKELINCFGSTGNGFEEDEVIISHPGNQAFPADQNVIDNLTWCLFEYATATANQPEQYDPGFFFPAPNKKPILWSSGMDNYDEWWSQKALIDMSRTLYPVISVFGHAIYWNLSLAFPPYSDMPKPANPREVYHFWSNAKYMLQNTYKAYYKDDRITLEFKANETLEDYVWKFPVEWNGGHFDAFKDNRSVGEIKYCDGTYVYVEFSQGQGAQKIEATYKPNANINGVSDYLQQIIETCVSQNLILLNGVLFEEAVQIRANPPALRRRCELMKDTKRLY